MSQFSEQLCRKNLKLHPREPGNHLNLNMNYFEEKGNGSSDATCAQMLLLGAMIYSHAYKPRPVPK